MPGFQETMLSEYVPPQQIVVLHPGSQNLRIGLATDLNPQTMLHVIARRLLPTGTFYRDPLLPQEVEKSIDQMQELDDARLQVSHTLQSCLQSDGRRRYATPPQQISAFNRRSQPDSAGFSGGDWTKFTGEYAVGDAVLQLNPTEEYNVHFPFRRGELNVHDGPGGSLTAVLANLETIWRWALQNKLGITSRDIKNYRAVLIIPDIYNRQHLKELTSLLLCKLKFGGCFLDHVAATFGAGLGYACVVDVGDQKTSVSCVEDGISHPSTRVRIDYGGGDVTQTFHWLLQKCAFPYKTCNSSNILDAQLLQQLKENFCHVDLNICGSQEKTFTVRYPQLPSQKFTLQVGDECIIAPLSFFTPELFGVTGPKFVHGQKGCLGDPEDPHDGNYLRETSRRGMKETLESAFNNPEGSQNNPLDIGGSIIEEEIVVDNIDTAVGGSSLVGNSGVAVRETTESCFFAEQLLGLDQAVLQSIDRCPTDDLKRKMYACILVVGGGMKFKGIGTWLQNRISLQIPYVYRGELLDIITSPKEMDPQMTTWKGAAIMASLESVHELWIKPKEWHDVGVKVLRERAPFMW
ncbi:hypothetical protein B566_EDAN015129 [Ephemera danica]|nr:hypothetical protein B566_EDAN015129 [Ephemera danica]